MDRRYQVFISSTYDDLKEERAKAITALLNIDCIPCGMEYFPAADEEAWECIERLIPECDYYVIILAGRYGSTPPGESKSYTHKEYELALKHGIPILGLVHGAPMKLTAEFCEHDAKARKKFHKFRNEVSRKLCRFWLTADQLSAELVSSLTKQIKNKPRPGWVRSDSLASGDAKDEIIRLRRKIEAQEKIIKDHLKSAQNSNETLASGSDPLLLRISGSCQNGDGTFSVSIKIRFLTTWDSIIRFSKNAMKGSWEISTFRQSIERAVADAVKLIPDLSYKKSPQISIPRDEMEKVENQLFALGIIAKKQYGYLNFTPKGDLVATRLVALKKGELDLPTSSSWFDLEITEIGQPQPVSKDDWDW
ncbi:MAG: DUF4062 domain-containing protein [Luteolibacter sp.]